VPRGELCSETSPCCAARRAPAAPRGSATRSIELHISSSILCTGVCRFWKCCALHGPRWSVLQLERCERTRTPAPRSMSSTVELLRFARYLLAWLPLAAGRLGCELGACAADIPVFVWMNIGRSVQASEQVVCAPRFQRPVPCIHERRAGVLWVICQSNSEQRCLHVHLVAL